MCWGGVFCSRIGLEVLAGAGLYEQALLDGCHQPLLNHAVPLLLLVAASSFALCVLSLCPSVPVVPLLEVPLEAADQPLLWDGHMRGQLIDSIHKVGQAVEAAFGGVAQDIEGVVLPDGQVVVVQSRPQVLPTAGSNGNGAK